MFLEDFPDIRSDHQNSESRDKEDGASKSNAYEVNHFCKIRPRLIWDKVAMACDLALYLLRQGSYSKEGDVVILVSNSD